jgi:hypothetical protein
MRCNLSRLVRAAATAAVLLVPAAVNAGVLGLLDPVASSFTQSTCRKVASLFKIDAMVDCNCTANLSLLRGSAISVACGVGESVCLVNDPVPRFCGTSNLNATYNLRKGIMKASACLDLDLESMLPADFRQDFNGALDIPQFCVQAFPKDNTRLRFDRCVLSIGDNECSSCQICKSGFDMSFDCSNIDLNPFKAVLPNLKILGPKVNSTCVALGLVLGNLTIMKENSLLPFEEAAPSDE